MRLVAVLPGTLRAGQLTLNPLRLRDGPFLARLFAEGEQRAGRLRPGSSWVSLWLKTRRTFRPAWVVRCSDEPIGFAGLYDVRLGAEARAALTIREDLRGRGHGTRALALLCRGLAAHGVVRTVLAEVEADNAPCLAMLRALGFADRGESRGRRIFSLDPSG